PAAPTGPTVCDSTTRMEMSATTATPPMFAFRSTLRLALLVAAEFMVSLLLTDCRSATSVATPFVEGEDRYGPEAADRHESVLGGLSLVSIRGSSAPATSSSLAGWARASGHN